jgi:hypothetical protein
VKEGHAFIVFSESNEELIGASYFTHDEMHCLYASGAYSRALFPLPIAHGTIWKGILYAKRIGIKKLNIGEIYLNGSNMETITQKEQSIAFFKRGFGGAIVPRMQLVL